MTYEEALQYIHAVSWKGSVPGLERITELMGWLGNPEKGLKFIHIVGTNGKGSTAARGLAALRMVRYGSLTNPNFRRTNEMNYRVIDKETYYRKGVFRHFSEDCKCSASMTARIDVTELVACWTGPAERNSPRSWPRRGWTVPSTPPPWRRPRNSCGKPSG